MTSEEAHILADKFAFHNAYYRSGHYQYGYISISYNHEQKLFELKKEDMSMDMYNPDVSYTYLNKSDFIAYLMQNYSFSQIDLNI